MEKYRFHSAVYENDRRHLSLLMCYDGCVRHVLADTDGEVHHAELFLEVQYGAFPADSHFFGGKLRDGERDEEGGFGALADGRQRVLFTHWQFVHWHAGHLVLVDFP